MDQTPNAVNSQRSGEEHNTLNGRFSAGGVTNAPSLGVNNSNYQLNNTSGNVGTVRIGEVVR